MSHNNFPLVYLWMESNFPVVLFVLYFFEEVEILQSVLSLYLSCFRTVRIKRLISLTASKESNQGTCVEVLKIWSSLMPYRACTVM